MQIECGKLFIDGGEGKIYEVKGRSDLLVKVYKTTTKELQKKIEYMKNHPPTSLLSKGCIAWPIDIIYQNGKMAGFVMPKLKSDVSLLQIYTYKHPLIDKTYDSSPSVQQRIRALRLITQRSVHCRNPALRISASCFPNPFEPGLQVWKHPALSPARQMFLPA